MLAPTAVPNRRAVSLTTTATRTTIPSGFNKSFMWPYPPRTRPYVVRQLRKVQRKTPQLNGTAPLMVPPADLAPRRVARRTLDFSVRDDVAWCDGPGLAQPSLAGRVVTNRPTPHLPPGSAPADTQRVKESPGRAGALRIMRNLGIKVP
jgi:hypothetical protein